MARGIGDESRNPWKYQDAPAQALCEGQSEPEFRFYPLYDKVWRMDILAHAWALAKANKGAPGVDAVTFERIEAAGLESWLIALQEELEGRTYRPEGVRRVHELLKAGYTDVVDADLSKYFDTIPHDELMQCVARLVSEH